MQNKLSIWSSYFWDLSPEDAVLTFVKNGIHCSELSDEHGHALLQRGDPVKVGREFKAFLAEHDFTMTQGHLLLSFNLCSDPLSTLFQWLDLFEAVGVQNAVLHVDHIPAEKDLSPQECMDRNIEKLKLVEAYLKEKQYKLRICLENLFHKIALNADELLYMLSPLDPDHFGICLDTGHLNLTVKNQAEFIEKAGSRLHALHIADNDGSYDQHKMPFSSGNHLGAIDFVEVFSSLQKIGYDGLYNMEINGENRIPLPAREFKLEYIRKCFDYLMNT